MKERIEIEDKYKWNLSSYCKNDEDYYTRVEKLRPYIEKIKSFEGKLDNDDMLLSCWEMLDEFYYNAGFVECYVSYRCDEDQRDSKTSEMEQKLSKILTSFGEASSYISPEIATFSLEKLENLKKNPNFSKYIPYIDDYIREKGHILSKEVENFISGMGDFLGSNSEVYRKYIDADATFADAENSKGEKLPLNSANMAQYLQSTDRKLRETAFINTHEEYGRHINFISSNYIASVKQDCFFAKKRNFPSALSKSIYREEASETVYKKLIEKVRENVDIVHDYFAIKANLLGLGDFAFYDKFAPVGKESDEAITYENAIQMVCSAVKPLGEQYVALVKRAANERWIDVYPNKGKRSGAYSCSVYDANPVVLLNFDDKKNYVSTIAHELGHALHSYYSNQSQPFQTANYVIFVAEVASTVNEMLLWRYNMKHCASKEEKIKLYDELFEMVNSTIFRQTMFSEFEALAHEMEEREDPLTKDGLCNKYFELNKYYYGDKIVLPECLKYEWARIPHFYRPFYVYKYATGLICALNLSKKIAEGDSEATAKYIEFLSSGSKYDPIKLLTIAGVNLEEDKSFDEVFAWLREILEDFKQLSI